MTSIKKYLHNRGVLLAFIVIVVVVIIAFMYLPEKSALIKLMTYLDTATALALAVLAFYAYWQYTESKMKADQFLKQLEFIEQKGKVDGLIGIVFGGGNKKASIEMEQFAKEKGIPKQFMMIKSFGDKENNQVMKEDIEKLESYLKNDVIPMLSGVDKIHLVVSGAGIAFYVCADILSNWKPIVVYHRNKEGKYEVWTTDNKHREKVEEGLKEVV